MTGATVDRYGIKERGYLKPGYKADLTILDPKKLKVDETKPDAKPEGIVHVYINGQAVLKDCQYLGGTFGRVLLKDGTEV